MIPPHRVTSTLQLNGLNYNELKNLAKRGRDKSYGYVINSSYRLYYDNCNSVKLYNRCDDDEPLLVYYPNKIIITANKTALRHMSNVVNIGNAIGIQLYAIPSNNKLRNYYSHYVRSYSNAGMTGDKLVHVPGETIINYNDYSRYSIMSLGSYTQPVINEQWLKPLNQKLRALKKQFISIAAITNDTSSQTWYSIKIDNTYDILTEINKLQLAKCKTVDPDFMLTVINQSVITPVELQEVNKNMIESIWSQLFNQRTKYEFAIKCNKVKLHFKNQI